MKIILQIHALYQFENITIDCEKISTKSNQSPQYFTVVINKEYFHILHASIYFVAFLRSTALASKYPIEQVS